jgi:DNA-directed RNA polymerase subunit RPC12/RpoP
MTRSYEPKDQKENLETKGKNMNIRCKKCGHIEETNLGLFVKIIGGAMPIGGFWAWTAFLFAGTGFALPIVIAIITGGVAILAFKDEIVKWIINSGYKCSNCGSCDWEA